MKTRREGSLTLPRGHCKQAYGREIHRVSAGLH